MANLILWNCCNEPVSDNSPSNIRSLSCYQLASWIRQHGYTVVVIDFCHAMKTKDLVNITQKYIGSDTLAIGVSSTFWQSASLRNAILHEPEWVINARSLLTNNIPWLLGGTYPASVRFRFNWIKFDGLSEDSLLKWMDENSGKLIRRDLFDITSCNTVFTKDDFIQSHEVLPMELGRGCQFKCKFCSYPLIGKKKGTYIKDVDVIKNELITNYNEYGTTKYYFLDDTVNESEEKIYALADIAQSLPFKLEWVGYNRLDLIWSRPGTIQALYDSGLRSSFFGIESFHPTASRVVGKGWNGKHGKDFLLELKEKWGPNITWFLSFIIGLPGEDMLDIVNTQDWCIDNNMYRWEFSQLNISKHPGKVWKSEFDTEYEKYGYRFDEHTMHKWKNDMWTFEEATRLSTQLNEQNMYSHVHAAFGLAAYVSLGHSFDELNHLKIKDFPFKSCKDEANRFIEGYVGSHLR
jgi:radical SAM superfamily enzyme YgiQ (UPF0313 family)